MSTHMRRSLPIICLLLSMSATAFATPPPRDGITFRARVGAGLEDGETTRGRGEEQVRRELSEPRAIAGIGMDMSRNNLLVTADFSSNLVRVDLGSRYEQVVRFGVGYYVGNLGADVGIQEVYSAAHTAFMPYLNITAGWERFYYAVSINSYENRSFGMDFDKDSMTLDLKLGSKLEESAVEFGLSLRVGTVGGLGGFWEHTFQINESTNFGYQIHAMRNTSLSLNLGDDFFSGDSFNISGGLMFSKAI